MNQRTGNLVGVILLLVLFAALGVRSSLAATGADLTAGQRAITILQWCYAVLAVLAIVGLLLRHGGTRLILLAWAALFVARNALTPVYIGGGGVGLALAGAAIGAAIAAGVIVLGFRALQRNGGSPAT